MSQKTLYYAQLAEDTARRLTGNWERWAGFFGDSRQALQVPLSRPAHDLRPAARRHRLRILRCLE